MPNQLTFDLALPPPTYSREDFVAAGGNREALAWIDRWPDWPAPALALSGPVGCGKTHLARIWAARAGAVAIEGRDLEGKSVADLSDMAAASPAIVVEGADHAPERALFHLYNLLRERGGHMLLTSALPPSLTAKKPMPPSAVPMKAVPLPITGRQEQFMPRLFTRQSSRPVRGS